MSVKSETPSKKNTEDILSKHLQSIQLQNDPDREIQTARQLSTAKTYRSALIGIPEKHLSGLDYSINIHAKKLTGRDQPVEVNVLAIDEEKEETLEDRARAYAIRDGMDPLMAETAARLDFNQRVEGGWEIVKNKKDLKKYKRVLAAKEKKSRKGKEKAAPGP